MSKLNRRYGRVEIDLEKPNDLKASQRTLLVGKESKGIKDGRVVVGSKTKSKRRLPSSFQGIQGREVAVNTRQPTEVINMPKKGQKTLKKHMVKFPAISRQTKKERLANIRLRIFALKYGYIWERKTFGQVSPAKARKHYEKCLLRKSLQQWEDFWWKGKNEWKLNIRADYHNRFRLWLKIWRSWRLFITMRRIKTTKIKLAQKKADQNRLVKFVTCWRSYVECRRKKKQFYSKAFQVGEILVKRLAFARWKTRLNYRRDLLMMEEQALHFWAKNLLFKAWECWIFNYNIAVEEKRKMAFAVHVYNRRMTFKVLLSFKLHCIQRKLKRLRLHSGERFYRLQSLRWWFLVWKTTCARKLHLVQFEDSIKRKGEKAKKRRMFLTWKQCILDEIAKRWLTAKCVKPFADVSREGRSSGQNINLRHCKEQQKYIAWKHFEISLKTKCFKALHQRVHQRDQKRSHSTTAITYYKTSLVRKAWNQWLTKCEDCEELRLMTLNRSVRNHYTVVLLKRMTKNWMIFCEIKKIRKAKKEKAYQMARRKLLPRYFGRWEYFVELIKEYRKTEEEANKFRRECLLAKTFYFWWRSYQDILDVQMLYRMAILSYDEKIRQKFFKLWMGKTRWKLRENRLLARGEDHYERTLKMKCLLKWNEVIVNINRSIGKLSVAIKYQNAKLVGSCWKLWIQFTERKRKKWKKIAIADICFQHRILNGTLAAWKMYSNKMTEIKCYVEERKMIYDKKTARKFFHRWRKHASCLKETKINHLRSFQHWEMKIKGKCFTVWRLYLASHLFQKQQSLLKIETVRKQLDQGKLQRYFKYWRRICFLKIASDNLNNTALEYWRKRTMKRYIDRWKMFRFLGYRKVVLQQQCMWYHNRRVIATYLKIWKSNFELRRKFRKKSHIALWLWSFTLQRKVFEGWLKYAREKKSRKVAVNDALTRRRQWLYKVAATQWIKFATNAIAERESFATNRHVRLSENVQRCVQRCALHWKRKTDMACRNRPVVMHQKKPNWQVLDVKDKKRVEVKGTKVVIPHVSKRPRPRRPEYLRESFNLSEILEHEHKASIETTDEHEALPRKWSSDFLPAPAPSHIQKPTNSSDDDRLLHTKNHDEKHGSPGHKTSRVKRILSHDLSTVSHDKLLVSGGGGGTIATNDIDHTSRRLPVSLRDKPMTSRDKSCDNPVESRGNLVLLPPSSFIGPRQEKTQRIPNTQGQPLKAVSIKATLDHVSPTRPDWPDVQASDNLPAFLCDKHNQQSIVQLRDRMLKYYTVATKLKDLRNRLTSLRQWAKEPRMNELDEQELELVHELIKKHSEDVETLNLGLEDSYGTISNDLQTFLDNLT